MTVLGPQHERKRALSGSVPVGADSHSNQDTEEHTNPLVPLNSPSVTNQAQADKKSPNIGRNKTSPPPETVQSAVHSHSRGFPIRELHKGLLKVVFAPPNDAPHDGSKTERHIPHANFKGRVFVNHPQDRWVKQNKEHPNEPLLSELGTRKNVPSHASVSDRSSHSNAPNNGSE